MTFSAGLTETFYTIVIDVCSLALLCDLDIRGMDYGVTLDFMDAMWVKLQVKVSYNMGNLYIESITF